MRIERGKQAARYELVQYLEHQLEHYLELFLLIQEMLYPQAIV
jgi:hypothetical protein